MKVWPKKIETHHHSVARAAKLGASHGELIREAIAVLSAEPGVDRLGLWIESAAPHSSNTQNSLGFSGIVWEPGGMDTPSEWTHLSPQAILPQELLTSGKTFEHHMEFPPERAFFGPLLDLRHALWVPIEKNGRLRGVLLAGTRHKNSVLPRAHVEAVAAELSLAFELEEKQRLCGMRQTDLTFSRKTLALLSGNTSASAVLESIVKNCALLSDLEGTSSVVFSAIALSEHFSAINSANTSTTPKGDFQWKSGDADWLNALESEPLSAVWRKALETRSVIGIDPGVSWAQGQVARVVAFPLEIADETKGVLVAGLRPGATSLIVLERLEQNAALAALALERQLREQQDSRRTVWQHTLLESGRDASLLLNAQGIVVGLSRGARELLSLVESGSCASDASVASNELFAQLFRAREQERATRWLRRKLNNSQSEPNAEDPFEVELRNGIRVRVHAVTPAGGEFTAVWLEQLPASSNGECPERSDLELRNLIEWLEEGVILFDANENVRFLNTRFAQMASLAPGESANLLTLDRLLTRLSQQAADPESFRERWKELAKTLESGVRDELQMLRPSPRVLERSARPVLDNIGRQIGRVEIYRDLTAHRVFQSKLLQTEKLAALGQMVTGIAHELSNPLTSITGYAQRLLLRKDSVGSLEEVHQIFQEAERASSILRQLLLHSRESLPERRKVSLNQVVQRAMDLQRFSLAAEKIRLEMNLDPTLPLVMGDAGHLQQVLMNLIGNARQALEQQGHGGTIGILTQHTSNNRVLLQISDNGPGIPSAILARIFDPFFTTKPAGIGTGLGLSIVLSVVREHGGQVRVASPPSGGATFTIELPSAAAVSSLAEPRLSSAQAAEHCTPANSAPRPKLRATSLQPRSAPSARILVVEDEPTVGHLIADVLHDDGFHVDLLLDGREALNRVEQETFDLVICDMKMPGLDGQHFYNSLRRAAKRPPKQFLFVTGDVVAAHTREFLEHNALPHLAKPFRIEELSEKVAQILQHKTPRQISAAQLVKKNAARNG